MQSSMFLSKQPLIKNIIDFSLLCVFWKGDKVLGRGNLLICLFIIKRKAWRQIIHKSTRYKIFEFCSSRWPTCSRSMGQCFFSAAAVLIDLPLFPLNTKSSWPSSYLLFITQNTSYRTLSIVTATMERSNLANSAVCGRPTADCSTAVRPSHDQFSCVRHLCGI